MEYLSSDVENGNYKDYITKFGKDPLTATSEIK